MVKLKYFFCIASQKVAHQISFAVQKALCLSSSTFSSFTHPFQIPSLSLSFSQP